MYRQWLTGIAWPLLATAISIPAATYEVAQHNPQANDDGDGTPERPWKTITKATEKVGPGDKVVICEGVYREQMVLRTSGTEQAPILFEAAPGAHVLLTGADHLTGWQKAGGGLPIYRIAWTNRFIGWSKNMTHPDDDYHRLIGLSLIHILIPPLVLAREPDHRRQHARRLHNGQMAEILAAGFHFQLHDDVERFVEQLGKRMHRINGQRRQDRPHLAAIKILEPFQIHLVQFGGFEKADAVALQPGRQLLALSLIHI